ncbi:MAG: T9SS type A sorting domain-containing protein [Flavobacteriales bacterium]|nr:T9SS type A sorting domain-containing protein [Flavobacteriales bacterium]
MRNLLLATAANLLVLCRTAEGQEVVRFDTVHQNVMGSFAVGHSVFETDSGYRVFSIQKGLAEMSQDIFVSEFNGSGGLDAERTFQSFQQDWMGSSSPVESIVSGYLTGMSRGLVVGPLDSLFLYKFDVYGDTSFTRFVAADTVLAMRGTAVTASGDVLLTGTHYPGLVNGGNEAFVCHLDSTGAIKGSYDYTGFYGEDVVEGRDGSWYLGGRGISEAWLNHAVLTRSDTLGGIIWQRVLPDNGRYVALIALNDHGIIGLGITGSGDEGGFSTAVKYDTSGTQVWRRDMLQSDDADRASIFQAGFETLDSSLVLCGWLSRADTYTKGTVVKLDKDGEVLWSRLYSHFQTGGVLPWQMFWDVKPTSDGGLVLTGEANSDDYPYGQLWLLKLDSMGCLVPGCGSVGVQEYTDLFQGKLLVSPNPASDRVSVALDLTEGVDVSGQVRAVLLDGTGRLVWQQTVQQDLNKLSVLLDVSALPAGTYYLHVRDAKRWLAGSKVIVE